MTERDDRMRGFKRARWVALNVYALYIAVGAPSFQERRLELTVAVLELKEGLSNRAE